jgi:hypothetical protein
VTDFDRVPPLVAREFRLEDRHRELRIASGEKKNPRQEKSACAKEKLFSTIALGEKKRRNGYDPLRRLHGNPEIFEPNRLREIERTLSR